MADQPTPTPLAKASAPADGAPIVPIVPMRPASERRTLARRSVGLVRRWTKDTFSKEQVVASSKAFLWVAPLALLVWIYAEREQQDKQQVSLQVTASSVDPGKVARIDDPDGNGVATI